MKNSYKNYTFKISALTWNEEFELPNGWYSVSDIQDNFEYILEKDRKKNVNPSIKTYINKIENRIMFKIKTGYYLELLKQGNYIKSLKSFTTEQVRRKYWTW